MGFTQIEPLEIMGLRDGTAETIAFSHHLNHVILTG